MKNNIITQKESRRFYCVKAIAILSVIAAHVIAVSEEPLFRNILTSIWKIFGNIGVICFFILGGFFYSRKKGDTGLFWKKKFKNLVIPWLFCSSLTYAWVLLNSRKFSLYEYIKWILGSGTLYYYIVIFLLFLFVFKHVYWSDKLLISVIVLNLLVLTMKTLHIIPDMKGVITNYLNPLYWIGFFAFGILLRKYRWDRKLLNSKWIWKLCTGVSICLLSVLYCIQEVSYFHVLAALFEISAFGVVLKLSDLLAKSKVSNVLVYIGKSSYCIYLLHLVIVQQIDNLMQESLLSDFISPFVGLFVMVLLIKLGRMICNKIPYGDRICNLVGLQK